VKILVADDDSSLVRHLQRGLIESDPEYRVDTTLEADEALWLGRSGGYDLIVLDVMMPGQDGISVLRQLRREEVASQVLLLTSKSGIEDKVHGLNAGADDYLTKPFAMEELLARVRALLRRERSSVAHSLMVEDLELDRVSRRARRGGRLITLTNREFSLLEMLMQASPNAVSKTAITERVWDQHFDSGTNIVNVYINQLRRKVDHGCQVALIQTVRGLGFAIRKPPGPA